MIPFARSAFFIASVGPGSNIIADVGQVCGAVGRDGRVSKIGWLFFPLVVVIVERVDYLFIIRIVLDKL